MPQSNFQVDSCKRCSKPIGFIKSKAYMETGKPVCPNCIERRINPIRIALGKMAIPINPNAYEVAYDDK